METAACVNICLARLMFGCENRKTKKFIMSCRNCWILKAKGTKIITISNQGELPHPGGSAQKNFKLIIS